MPLSDTSKAKSIIHKLDQPHRFRYALNTADGFQHHGFELADVQGFARNRIAQRYGVPASEVDEHIFVAPDEFTTVGGMNFNQVKDAFEAWKAKQPTKPAAKPLTK